MRCDRRFFEDGRTAFEHIHTVHAVGTGTRRRQSAVLNGQLAAVHGDQSLAVEARTVLGSGDLAVARDRQITSGGYLEQLRRIGFHFFARQVEGDLLGYRDVLIGDVIQQGNGVAILCRCDRIRQCRIVALTDLRHRLRHDVRAVSLCQPGVAFGQRQCVGRGLDRPVRNARRAGLLVHKHLRAGTRAHRNSTKTDRLINVRVPAGDAIVAVERAAVDGVCTCRRRIDRRAEVAPPIIRSRRRVRGVSTAVDRDGRGRRRVVRADRSEPGIDRRAVEDRRAAVEYVHAVHAVSAGTGRRQSAVVQRQLAAVDRDHGLAVEVLAVGRPGDLAVAGDRQIAVSRYVEQLNVVRLHFIARQVDRDLLSYFDVLIGDVRQQRDGVASLSRRHRVFQCRIVALTDLRHRCNDGECARLSCYSIIRVFTQSYGDFILASILTFRTAQRAVERFALHYAFHRGSQFRICIASGLALIICLHRGSLRYNDQLAINNGVVFVSIEGVFVAHVHHETILCETHRIGISVGADDSCPNTILQNDADALRHIGRLIAGYNVLDRVAFYAVFLTIVGHRLSSAVSGNNDLQILAPLGREGQVGGDGVDGPAIFELEFVGTIEPALEGVTFLGGCSGVIDLVAVIDLDSSCLRAVSRIEGHGMDLDPVQVIHQRTISINSRGLGGQRWSPQVAVNQRPLATKRILGSNQFCLLGFCQRGGQSRELLSSQRRAVLDSRHLPHMAHAVGEDDGHIHTLPSGNECQIRCGHLFRDSRVTFRQGLPFNKGVVFLCRVGRRGDLSVIVLSDLKIAELSLAIHECDGILVDRPMRIEGNISSDRCVIKAILVFRISEIPAFKSVPSLSRSIRLVNCFAISHVDSFYRGAAVSVKLYGPLGVNMVIVVNLVLLGPVSIRRVIRRHLFREITSGDIDIRLSIFGESALHFEAAVERTAGDS